MDAAEALLAAMQNELYLPRAGLLGSNYASMPMDPWRQNFLRQPLAAHVAGTAGGESAWARQRRPMFMGADDPATIDRDGPYVGNANLGNFRNHPYLYDDLDGCVVPDRSLDFPYSYPLSTVASGGRRWGLEQIHAYNRKVLLHNAGIGQRRAERSLFDQQMYPMMDVHGRFPGGFDRPMGYEEFVRMEEPVIDSHRQHFGLPNPDTLGSLLMLDTAERRLKRQLKQVQLLEFYGAKKLAEQFALQLVAAQDLIPGLRAPEEPGYGLGPDFDDVYLSAMLRGSSGGSGRPLDAIAYGNGLANWNFPLLLHQSGDGGHGPNPPGPAGPWHPATLAAPPPYHPAGGAGVAHIPRSVGQPRNYWPGPAAAYGGIGGGARCGPWTDERDRWAFGAVDRPGLRRDLERISCDGGRGRRPGRFN